jgi:alpha-ketoglutaric semialdehyde dehydrogenase
MKVYLILICLVAAAGGFLFGFDTSVISGAIEFMEAPAVFNLDELEKGWTVSCIIIGCMTGCIFAGPLSDRYGRKTLLIFTALVFLLSSLGCALAQSNVTFVINRIIAGFAVGSASMLAPIYIAEISPAKHRGKLVSLNLFAIFLGQSAAFFSNFLLRDVGGVDNWRWMIGIQVIPSGILLLLLFFIPESPRWLIEKNSSSLALGILTRINGRALAESELAKIEESVNGTGKGKFAELFKGKLLRLMLIGIALAVAQQVTGINVIMYYAPSIFKSAGFAADSALFQTALMGLVNLTFAVIAMFCVDKLGRKPLMIMGSIGMGVSLLLLAITFMTNNFEGYLVLFCIMGFLASFGFSLGPVVFVLISEIFPNNLRSHAVAVCIFFLWTANFIVSFSFPYLLKHLQGYSFLIFSLMCFLTLAFVMRFLTETKGKSLEQIAEELVGEELIGENTEGAQGKATFQAFAPAKNQYLPEKFRIATYNELQTAVDRAGGAFQEYAKLSYGQRAEFLEAIAQEIMALGAPLIEKCVEESGLSAARITGERGRTCSQLQLFAKLLRDGWWVDARIDLAQPERMPLARPDIRRILVPIGPVAVFGAINFPLAFSTAGGDTASALAAGCPVIFKNHPAHPGTSELVASAILKAARETGMPEGVFSALNLSNEDAVKLVQQAGIKAVGFTGSRDVGMILFDAAKSRREPIPVYAEMSAVNPVVLFEDALLTRKDQIAKELAASVTLGAGQFCTNPGLVVLIESEVAKVFVEEFVNCMNAVIPATMLSPGIYKAYAEGLKSLQNRPDITLLGLSYAAKNPDCQVQPAVHSVKAADFLLNKRYAAEIFGPVTLIVNCKDEAERHQVLASLEGQLTATLHATAKDRASLPAILEILGQKAGRIIYGGYPTGVEVCHAMHHGGPFPATTDGRSTSVGSAAIYRFVRPLAYQDFPDELLPIGLQKDNPLDILRLLNGNWTKDKS